MFGAVLAVTFALAANIFATFTAFAARGRRSAHWAALAGMFGGVAAFTLAAALFPAADAIRAVLAAALEVRRTLRTQNLAALSAMIGQGARPTLIFAAPSATNAIFAHEAVCTVAVLAAILAEIWLGNANCGIGVEHASVAVVGALLVVFANAAAEPGLRVARKGAAALRRV